MPGRDAAHVAGAHEQPVARHLGVGGVVAQGPQEQRRESQHAHQASRRAAKTGCRRAGWADSRPIARTCAATTATRGGARMSNTVARVCPSSTRPPRADPSVPGGAPCPSRRPPAMPDDRSCTTTFDARPDYSTWDVATHGPEPRPGLGRHRPQRARHRTRHPQDRQGGRRPPRRARPARRPEMPARGQALPHRRAPDVPPRRRLHGGPAGAAEPRDAARMARRTEFGRELLPASGPAPSSPRCPRCGQLGAPVPYPVQLLRHRADARVHRRRRTARPRRGWPRCRPAPDELADLFDQCVDAMRLLARAGYAHGDLSAVQPAGRTTAGW